MMKPVLMYGTKSTYQLVGGLLLYSKNSQCDNAHKYVLTLGGILRMMLTLSCPSNQSSYFSWSTLYFEHAISKWYTSSTRFSLHTLHIFMFVWWCHDAISTPNLCEQGQRSEKTLQEPMLMWVVRRNWNILQCDLFFPSIGDNIEG